MKENLFWFGEHYLKLFEKLIRLRSCIKRISFWLYVYWLQSRPKKFSNFIRLCESLEFRKFMILSIYSTALCTQLIQTSIRALQEKGERQEDMYLGDKKYSYNKDGWN